MSSSPIFQIRSQTVMRIILGRSVLRLRRVRRPHRLCSRLLMACLSGIRAGLSELNLEDHYDTENARGAPNEVDSKSR